MESCSNDQIKAFFLSFFKDSHISNAEKIYSHYGPYSPQASVACCYMKCIISLSKWDEEGIREAYSYTKSTHKMLVKLQVECQRQSFSTPIERLLLKVLSGEALLLIGLMKMAVKRCMKHYVKAGLHLRASWRIFTCVQSEIQHLCQRTGTSSPDIDPEIAREFQNENPDTVHTDTVHSTQHTDDVLWADVHSTEDDDFLAEFDLVEDMNSFFKSDWGIPTVQEIHVLKTISQFGFGIFHLVLSLIPPTILKIVNLFGFEGNRYLGISSLRYVSKDTHNFRCVFSCVVLLWYNLIVRPAYITDIAHVQPGITQAEGMLDVLEGELAGSWLLLFFRARIHKLQQNYARSLELLEGTAAATSHLHEIRTMSLYEIGWCQLIQCDWDKAALTFHNLMVEARWSKGWYGYIAAVSGGAGGDVGACLEILRSVPGLTKKSMNVELDTYCLRQSEGLCTTAPTHLQYEAYIRCLELLYLWRCLHFSHLTANTLLTTVQGRPADLRPAVLAASYLLAGVAWRYLDHPHKALQAWRIVDTVKYESPRDVYLTVCALCETSTLFESQGNIEQARVSGRRAATEFKAYDLESKLYMTVRSRQL